MVRNDAALLNLPGKGGTMSTPFIKYTPGIEAADPRFDETLQTVIATPGISPSPNGSCMMASLRP
jgi:hypothetical protein